MSENSARGRGGYRGGNKNLRGGTRGEQRAELMEDALKEAARLPDGEDLPLEELPEDDDLLDETLPDGGEPIEVPDGETLPYEVEVVGVRFRTSGKVYYFDPCGKTYPVGAHAIVETARGIEYGEVSFSNRVVKGSEVVAPLRKAIRIATPLDDDHYEENRKKEKEAFDLCVSRINAHGLEMKLIDAEYTFDNTKLLFYFTADGRVDFRDLVKNLASLFRCRIELRQMGIRDEAKALGGLGICGRPYCCHSFLPDFVQVSIKMAKEQNLSLNAAKISGACGRLMCCLRYEYDTYLEEGRRTPKEGSIVHNAEGDFKVIEAKPLTGMLKVRPANDPEGDTRILNRDEVEPGPGPERPANAAPAATTAAVSAAAKAFRQAQKPAEEKPKNEQPSAGGVGGGNPNGGGGNRHGHARGHRGGRKNHGKGKKGENSGSQG